MSVFRLLAFLLFAFFVISQSPVAAARPLTPELNLALPGALPEKIRADSDGVVVVKKQNVPCEMSSENGEVKLMKRVGAGYYGSLLLSSLPKGKPVPPSGPSRRTNDFNN